MGGERLAVMAEFMVFNGCANQAWVWVWSVNLRYNLAQKKGFGISQGQKREK
jgi:hypothetical protein